MSVQTAATASVTPNGVTAVGAELVASNRCAFRVWAPRAKTARVVFEDGRAVAEMRAAGDGYFGVEAAAGAGSRYRIALDALEAMADPASRFQPEGVFGPSEVVQLSKFQFADGAWRGIELRAAIIYELHVGTFTREGNAGLRDCEIGFAPRAWHHSCRADAGVTIFGRAKLGL